MSENPTKPDTGSPEAGTGTPTPAQPDNQQANPGAGDSGANQKPEAEKGTEGGRVVPEQYTLKLPDGAVLDASAVEEVAAFAKERKLTNEEAQAILERDNAKIASYHEAQRQKLAQQVEQWVVEAKADKEIGGEAFPKNVEMAKRVLDRFAPQEFKDALNETGLGNHPELIRVFARIAKAMSEDQLVVGGPSAQTQKSPEEVFYPTQK